MPGRLGCCAAVIVAACLASCSSGTSAVGADAATADAARDAAPESALDAAGTDRDVPDEAPPDVFVDEAPPDALPDGFICPDLDHDGHRAAWCGGDDCCDSGTEGTNFFQGQGTLGCSPATAASIHPGGIEDGDGDGIDQNCDGWDTI